VSGSGFRRHRADPLPTAAIGSTLLTFRDYDCDKLAHGERTENGLYAAMCYWRSFVAADLDMFGGKTFERPWFARDDMANAKLKAEVAFEMLGILGFPIFAFHERDIAPEGASLARSASRARRSRTAAAPQPPSVS
jgi:xylose isomerase